MSANTLQIRLTLLGTLTPKQYAKVIRNSKAYDPSSGAFTEQLLHHVPGRGGMTQNGGKRAGRFMAKCVAAEKARAGLRHAMPERDGKDQGEDSPKQPGSCWFARHS